METIKRTKVAKTLSKAHDNHTKIKNLTNLFFLTLQRPRSFYYRKQSIDLQSESFD